MSFGFQSALEPVYKAYLRDHPLTVPELEEAAIKSALAGVFSSQMWTAQPVSPTITKIPERLQMLEPQDWSCPRSVWSAGANHPLQETLSF